MAAETIEAGDMSQYLPLILKRMEAAWPPGQDEFRDELHTGYWRILREIPPLSVTVAWPAGIPEDARATLRAQLQDELKAAALTRLVMSAHQLTTAGSVALSAAQRLAQAASRAAKP